jgi:hypothetical protein
MPILVVTNWQVPSLHPMARADPRPFVEDR